MKGLVLLLLVAAAIVAAVVFIKPSSTPAPGPAGATGAASVMAASEFSVEGHKGGVLVMDFWATWCPPCRAAMPGVQRLHEKFQGRPVHVVGINTSENADPVAYMQNNGFTYRLVTGGDALAKHYKVEGIPTFIIIGVDGEVLHRAVGHSPTHEQEFADIIEADLKKHGL